MLTRVLECIDSLLTSLGCKFLRSISVLRFSFHKDDIKNALQKAMDW